MPVPIFDFYCECGNEKIDVYCKVDDGIICNKCFSSMKRKCNCSHFKLLYDNKKDSCGWGYDGYASSQYWKDVKAARERGEDVKACNED
jgi:hypothetical protein